MHARGLILTPPERRVRRAVVQSSGVKPDKLDNAAYMTPVLNQGDSPMCVAYAVCAALRAIYWRTHGQLRDFSETDLYGAAKAIDGNLNPGTQLESGLSAAEELFGITVTTTSVDDSKDYPYAIHQHGIVLCSMATTQGWEDLRWNRYIGSNDTQIGPHAVVGTGYNDVRGVRVGKNSWGPRWGLGGYWCMTAEQFDNQFMYGYTLDIKWS